MVSVILKKKKENFMALLFISRLSVLVGCAIWIIIHTENDITAAAKENHIQNLNESKHKPEPSRLYS
jgi:hypothetical protein